MIPQSPLMTRAFPHGPSAAHWAATWVRRWHASTLFNYRSPHSTEGRTGPLLLRPLHANMLVHSSAAGGTRRVSPLPGPRLALAAGDAAARANLHALGAGAAALLSHVTPSALVHHDPGRELMIAYWRPAGRRRRPIGRRWPGCAATCGAYLHRANAVPTVFPSRSRWIRRAGLPGAKLISAHRENALRTGSARSLRQDDHHHGAAREPSAHTIRVDDAGCPARRGAGAGGDRQHALRWRRTYGDAHLRDGRRARRGTMVRRGSYRPAARSSSPTRPVPQPDRHEIRTLGVDDETLARRAPSRLLQGNRRGVVGCCGGPKRDTIRRDRPASSSYVRCEMDAWRRGDGASAGDGRFGRRKTVSAAGFEVQALDTCSPTRQPAERGRGARTRSCKAVHDRRAVGAVENWTASARDGCAAERRPHASQRNRRRRRRPAHGRLW